jgi:hypothetical protein
LIFQRPLNDFSRLEFTDICSGWAVEMTNPQADSIFLRTLLTRDVKPESILLLHVKPVHIFSASAAIPACLKDKRPSNSSSNAELTTWI